MAGSFECCARMLLHPLDSPTVGYLKRYHAASRSHYATREAPRFPATKVDSRKSTPVSAFCFPPIFQIPLQNRLRRPLCHDPFVLGKDITGGGKQCRHTTGAFLTGASCLDKRRVVYLNCGQKIVSRGSCIRISRLCCTQLYPKKS